MAWVNPLPKDSRCLVRYSDRDWKPPLNWAVTDYVSVKYDHEETDMIFALHKAWDIPQSEVLRRVVRLAAEGEDFTQCDPKIFIREKEYTSISYKPGVKKK